MPAVQDDDDGWDGEPQCQCGADLRTTGRLSAQSGIPLVAGTAVDPAAAARRRRPANLAPIVLARIDTERSYFQFKDSVQELVRSVIEAYWSIVFARTDVWAREQQVKQAQFAYDRTVAAFAVGSADVGETAQAKTALANFRRQPAYRRTNLLQREAAFRNLLGFPAYDPEQITPVTPPIQDRLDMDWEQILSLAEENRPDVIELKLVLEADQQLLYQARKTSSAAHRRRRALPLERPRRRNADRHEPVVRPGNSPTGPWP